MARVEKRKSDGPPKASGRPRVVKLFDKNWRLWASLPVDAQVLLVLGPPDRQRKPGTEALIAAIPRPTFPRGVCQKCGCTELDACEGAFGDGCAWTDSSQTLCTSCVGK